MYVWWAFENFLESFNGKNPSPRENYEIPHEKTTQAQLVILRVIQVAKQCKSVTPFDAFALKKVAVFGLVSYC